MIDNFDLNELTWSDALAVLNLTMDDIELLRSQRIRLQLDHRGVVDKVPVKEALDAYLANSRNPYGVTRPLRPGSLYTYKPILEDFFRFLLVHNAVWLNEIDIVAMSLQYLGRLSNVKSIENSTYNKYVSVIRSFLRFVRFHYGLTNNHLPGYFPKKERLPRALSLKQIHALLYYAKAKSGGIRSYFLVSFCLGTGLRRNEFRLMRVRDLDFGKFLVHIPHGKGQKPRTVPVPNRVMEITKDYLEFYGLNQPNHFVFGDTKDPHRPVSNQALDQHVQRLMAKLHEYRKGDPVYGYTMHTMRHTYATYLLLHQVPLRTIAACLGHKSVTTTEIYTGLDTEGLRKVIQPALDYMSELLGEFHVE